VTTEPRRYPALVGLAAATLLAAAFAGACGRAEQKSHRFPSRAPDVPYIPTPEDVVEEMLRLAEVTRNDLVYDLGSGDGRIVIAAAKKHGARGVGIELDPNLIEISRRKARLAGVEHMVTFLEADLFRTDLSAATVVTLYLIPTMNLALRPKLLRELSPGTRIVSHKFDMGDWSPLRTVHIYDSAVHLWVVPPRTGAPPPRR